MPGPNKLFLYCAIYGVLVIFPQYWLETQIGKDYPPAITHPEYFYGFIGVGLAWQIAFFVISTDPARYKWIILPGIVEKLGFGLAVWRLYFHGRVPTALVVFGAIDLIMAALFLHAFLRIRAYEFD